MNMFNILILSCIFNNIQESALYYIILYKYMIFIICNFMFEFFIKIKNSWFIIFLLLRFSVIFIAIIIVIVKIWNYFFAAFAQKFDFTYLSAKNFSYDVWKFEVQNNYNYYTGIFHQNCQELVVIFLFHWFFIIFIAIGMLIVIIWNHLFIFI